MRSIPAFVFAALAAALLLTVFPDLGQAQNIGFRVGIAPPPVVAGQPVSTFVPTVVLPNPLPITRFPLVPASPTVIVPNSVLVPGQTFIPPPIVNPVPVVNPAPFAVPPSFPRVPRVGTPRAEVLRVLGQPSVTIITSSGETLYFSGGVTVIIQNGQVVGTR
jgi:hypothetical protein